MRAGSGTEISNADLSMVCLAEGRQRFSVLPLAQSLSKVIGSPSKMTTSQPVLGLFASGRDDQVLPGSGKHHIS